MKYTSEFENSFWILEIYFKYTSELEHKNINLEKSISCILLSFKTNIAPPESLTQVYF